MDDEAVQAGGELAVLPGSRSPLGPDRVVPRGRHGHSREEIRSLHRARLLDAFVEVVGGVGYDNTRVVDVCQRAGVSNRAFYAAFSDKEDCFYAAFDIGTRFLVERTVEAYRSAEGTWPERVRVGIDTALSYLAANPAFARFCTVEPARVGPEAVERLNRVIEECRSVFEADGRAVAFPELRDGPREALLVGAVVRPIFGYIEDGKTEELPDLSPSLVHFLSMVVMGSSTPDRELDPA
ncbi:MAG: TetR/AcrR family transcriptional regulator [Acidimicrobiales bacterium]